MRFIEYSGHKFKGNIVGGMKDNTSEVTINSSTAKNV